MNQKRSNGAKQLAEITKQSATQFIALDAGDRAFLLPRVRKAVDGRQAETDIKQYMTAIARRSGFPDNDLTLDGSCTKILVRPITSASEQ